jgi:hypothetical protein
LIHYNSFKAYIYGLNQELPELMKDQKYRMWLRFLTSAQFNY